MSWELYIEPERPIRDVRGRFLKGYKSPWKRRHYAPTPRQTEARRRNAAKAGGRHPRPVIALDGDGNLVAWFSSALEAARRLGISRKTIYHSIHGRVKYAAGYRWVYDQNIKKK